MVSVVAALAYRLLQACRSKRFPDPVSLFDSGSATQTPPVTFPVLVYSHRGGGLEVDASTENTMPAFRNSARMGVDLLELDVQLTRDGRVAVFHDEELGRM